MRCERDVRCECREVSRSVTTAVASSSRRAWGSTRWRCSCGRAVATSQIRWPRKLDRENSRSPALATRPLVPLHARCWLARGSPPAPASTMAARCKGRGFAPTDLDLIPSERDRRHRVPARWRCRTQYRCHRKTYPRQLCLMLWKLSGSPGDLLYLHSEIGRRKGSLRSRIVFRR